MPQAIPAIAAAFATATASATAFVSALAFKGTLMAGLAAWGKVATYAALAASLFMKPPGLQGSGQNINIQLAGSTAPLPILLGMTGTQGLVTLRKTYADKNEVLAVDTVLSIGPVESIESFSVMDRGITYTGDPHTGTALITGVDGVDMKASKLFRYGGFTFAHRTGEPDDYDTISDILGEAVPEIGPEHGMPGLARTIFRLKLDEKQLNFPQGFPDNPVSVVKGIKCYDPRKDSTQTSIGGSGSHRFDDPSTHEWTENPAILALNFGLGVYNQHNGRKLFGLGLGQGNHRSALDSVNFAQFAAAANVCDANRWTCGGVVTTQDNRWAIVTNIMASGGAVPLNSGGRLGCFVRAPKISVFTLRADDVIGTRKITTGQPISQRANRIIPNYRSPDHKYEIVAGTALTHETWLSDDRYDVRTTETTYPLVQNPVQAGQLAAYELADSREFLEAEITCKPRALNVEVGDCIETDLTEFNPGQEWIVVDRRWNSSTKTVTLTLKAETYEKHAFCLGNSTIPPRTPTLRTDDPTRHPGPDALDWDIVDNKIVGPRVIEVAPGIFEERPHTHIPAIVIEGGVKDGNVNKVIVETRPHPYTGPITPTDPGDGGEEPSVGDPHFDKVTMLTQFDGFVEGSPMPNYGSENIAFNGDLMSLDYPVGPTGFGTTVRLGHYDYLATDTAPSAFGSGDFTVELRYLPEDEAPPHYLIGQYGDQTNQRSWTLGIKNAQLFAKVSSNGATADMVDQEDFAALEPGWNSICIERGGDIIRVYRNGEMVMKQTVSGPLFTSNAPLTLNGFMEGDTAGGEGQFDEVRITKGLARYNDDQGYVHSTLPFPTVEGEEPEGPTFEFEEPNVVSAFSGQPNQYNGRNSYPVTISRDGHRAIYFRKGRGCDILATENGSIVKTITTSKFEDDFNAHHPNHGLFFNGVHSMDDLPGTNYVIVNVGYYNSNFITGFMIYEIVGDDLVYYGSRIAPTPITGDMMAVGFDADGRICIACTAESYYSERPCLITLPPIDRVNGDLWQTNHWNGSQTALDADTTVVLGGAGEKYFMSAFYTNGRVGGRHGGGFIVPSENGPRWYFYISSARVNYNMTNENGRWDFVYREGASRPHGFLAYIDFSEAEPVARVADPSIFDIEGPPFADDRKQRDGTDETTPWPTYGGGQPNSSYTDQMQATPLQDGVYDGKFVVTFHKEYNGEVNAPLGMAIKAVLFFFDTASGQFEYFGNVEGDTVDTMAEYGLGSYDKHNYRKVGATVFWARDTEQVWELFGDYSHDYITAVQFARFDSSIPVPQPPAEPGVDDGWQWAAEGNQTVTNFTLAPLRPNASFMVSIKYVNNLGAISDRIILGPVTTVGDVAGDVGRDVIDWRNVIRNSLTSLSASYVATEENLTGTTPFEVAECWVDVEGITTPVEVDFNAFFSFVHDAAGTFTTNFEIRRSPDSGPGVQILHMSHDGTGLRNDTLAGMYPFKVIDRPSSGIWRYVMRVWSDTDNFTVQKTQARFIRATEYKTNGTAPPPETP